MVTRPVFTLSLAKLVRYLSVDVFNSTVLCIISQNFVKRNNDVHYTTNYCTYICRTVFADDELSICAGDLTVVSTRSTTCSLMPTFIGCGINGLVTVACLL